MGGEAERKVERADRGDCADRDAPDDANAATGGRIDVEREQLAIQAFGLFRRSSEDERAAVDLDLGVADRLARLGGKLLGERDAIAGHSRGDMPERVGAFVGCEPGEKLLGGHGRGRCALELRSPGVIRGGDGAIGLAGCRDDERLLRPNPVAGDIDRPVGHLTFTRCCRLRRGRGGHAGDYTNFVAKLQSCILPALA
jgi:hypothetical protein